MNSLLRLLFGAVLGTLLAASAVSAAGLRFLASGTNEYSFDTGVLRGKLRAGGRSTGLSSVVYTRTGMRLDASMGLLGHYRVFTSNKRYGTAAWDWPSEARLADDGSVQMRWPATAERPFELRATYRLILPDCVDLETAVEAKADLPKFESFVASYFTSSFTNAAVETGEREEFTPADQSAGVWQAFPRDDVAVEIIKDGRWKIEPNPVDWVIRPKLAQAMGYRCAPAPPTQTTALLMAPTNDCFAILTPHQTEPHYSMYLSLFGRDVKAGETARAHAGLAVQSDSPDAAKRAYYRFYLRRIGGARR